MSLLKTGGAIAALLGVLMLGGCQSLPRQAAGLGTLIRNVTVVPMDQPGLLGKRDLLLQEGRIVSIARAGSTRRRVTDVVDGTGKYLMPGLWDMHAHALLDDRRGRPSPASLIMA